MSIAADPRCCNCQTIAARLDENGWCEQCWLGLRPAYQLFYELEELVKQTLETGVLTAAQLQEALRMSLADEDGTLPGTGFRREAVEMDDRGIWHAPSSAFDECGERRNQIALLRRSMKLSLEALAARIGVSVQTLALWESDVLPSAEDWPALERLAEMLGCSTAFLLDHDRLIEDGD
jgi:DNA-binding XRE family transcriptional regulator